MRTLLGDLPSAAQEPPRFPAQTGAVTTQTLPATRVLVVDDEAGIVEFVATALRYEGFDVAVADDGRSALAQVTSFRPELVVLDVMLPDLDGFEVARRLVADGVRVPIIFLTARDGTE